MGLNTMSPQPRDQHFLEAKINQDLASQPQRQALGQHALAAVLDGLGKLAALGYKYELVETSGVHQPPKPQEYPKMLYLAGKPEITVEDEVGEAEARDRGYDDLHPKPKPAPMTEASSDTKTASTETKPAASRLLVGAPAPNA